MTRIVIIGAGPAGINAAQAFAAKLKPADDVEVTILEKSKFYYHTVGAPRAYTEETYAKKMFIPYDNAIPAHAKSFVKLVRAVATRISVEPNEVYFQRISDDDDKPVTETETVAFDYLIVATGSTYSVPIKQDPTNYSRAHAEQLLKEVREQIAKAEKILIVGGGAVGCEVAGDIASHYPTKQVTILEGRDKLVAVNNVRDKFRNYLSHSLEKLKIKVILGERLEERLTGNSFEKRTLRTDKGTEIESDIQLLCGGFHPVAALVLAMDATLVDDKGSVKVNDLALSICSRSVRGDLALSICSRSVKVNDLLQIDNAKYYHIFALGDVVNHKTPKLAYWAGEQAKHLANELVAVIRKTQPQVTKPFPAVTVEALIMPLGPNGGVSQLPVWGGSVVGDMMTRMVKAKDMFAGRIWGSLGATVPN